MPDSAYTVTFGGSDKIPATTLTDVLFLPGRFTIATPDLESNGPLSATTSFLVKWTPAESSTLPTNAQVMGAVWLADERGAPTHLCATDHALGQIGIPSQTIAEYRAIAQARGRDPNKVILRRDAMVHQLSRLPSLDPANARRIDMLGLFSWAQLMDCAP